jgi:hypothetical protein
VSKPLKALLKNHKELGLVLAQARALSDLQLHFTAVCPPDLAPSVQVLALRAGSIIVAASNSAIAAKLRQIAPELVPKLRNRGCEVSGIRVKVQVSFEPPPPEKTAHKLSVTAHRALQDLSSSLGDSPLRHSVDKLIRIRKN